MELDKPVSAISGIGEVYARTLKQHGVATIRDLLYFFPYRYLDYSHVTPINELHPGQTVVIQAKIVNTKVHLTKRRRMNLLTVTLSDGTGDVRVTWFNQLFLFKQLRQGQTIRVSGLIKSDGLTRGLYFSNPDFQFDLRKNIVPIYGTKAGLSNGLVTRIIQKVLSEALNLVDPLPVEIINKYELTKLPDAVYFLHSPENQQQISNSRDRLALDELWQIMIFVKQLKTERQNKAVSFSYDTDGVKNDLSETGFQLTRGQTTALTDIITDISKTVPMRRLLNGDVGSGKTLVAFLAARVVTRQGQNVIFLAPSTVLAEQHYANWQKFFPQTSSFLVMSGHYMHGNKKLSRNKIADDLKTSRGSMIIGTHALLSDGWQVENEPGLVIVDEQHRFGVSQRAKLMSGDDSMAPHLLSMSATPIPRTAALVLYGDLDVSIIPDKPAGRKPIITKLVPEKSRELVYRFIDQHLAKGFQAFVVCPLIENDLMNEQSDNSDQLFSLIEEKKAAKYEFERIQKEVFPNRRVGLLHGKMKIGEKKEVLDAFIARQIDILVTTTVIEVGVDIPNANIMMIEGAEFFGLAQLHQLRGRIGRGGTEAFCFLFTASSHAQNKARLKFLTTCNDGFELARKDLQFRGPGQVFGVLQAGFKQFKFANLGDWRMVDLADKVSNTVLNDKANWSGDLREVIVEQKIRLLSELREVSFPKEFGN